MTTRTVAKVVTKEDTIFVCQVLAALPGPDRLATLERDVGRYDNNLA